MATIGEVFKKKLERVKNPASVFNTPIDVKAKRDAGEMMDIARGLKSEINKRTGAVAGAVGKGISGLRKGLMSDKIGKVVKGVAKGAGKAMEDATRDERLMRRTRGGI